MGLGGASVISQFPQENTFVIDAVGVIILASTPHTDDIETGVLNLSLAIGGALIRIRQMILREQAVDNAQERIIVWILRIIEFVSEGRSRFARCIKGHSRGNNTQGKLSCIVKTPSGNPGSVCGNSTIENG